MPRQYCNLLQRITALPEIMGNFYTGPGTLGFSFGILDLIKKYKVLSPEEIHLACWMCKSYKLHNWLGNIFSGLLSISIAKSFINQKKWQHMHIYRYTYVSEASAVVTSVCRKTKSLEEGLFLLLSFFQLKAFHHSLRMSLAAFMWYHKLLKQFILHQFQMQAPTGAKLVAFPFLPTCSPSQLLLMIFPPFAFSFVFFYFFPKIINDSSKD